MTYATQTPPAADLRSYAPAADLCSYERADDLPATSCSAHGGLGSVFAGRAWLRAWERATIEDVSARRYVTSRCGDGRATLPLYRMDDSPYWRAYEQEAGLDPIFTRPIVCLPSMYAFYGPVVAGNLDAVAHALAEVQATASEWSAQAVVVANLTETLALDLARLRPPDATVRLDTSYRLELPEHHDAYFASLKRDHRADLRRRWRRAGERGVRCVELIGHDARPRLAEFLEIADASAIKHDTDPIYDLPTLTALADVPGSRLILAEREGQILAGFFSFVDGDCLTLWSGGIRYESLHEFSPYVFLLYETVALAYERGWRQIDFGRGNGGFKTRHGARPIPLWSHFYLADDDDALIAELRLLHDRIALNHP
jgi:hypothetical protein